MGRKICQHLDEEGALDCTSSARSSTMGTGPVDMCIRHGGGPRCQHIDEVGASDCTSSAQSSKTGTGTVGMCIRHGGGDRCQHQDEAGVLDCDSSAQSSKTGTGAVGMCTRHGGGDRCQHKDEAGTLDCQSRSESSKTGTGTVGMCTRHGGGDRCQHKDDVGASDCTSSAVHSKTGTGAGGMCIRHGGGDRCQHVDGTGASNCTSSAKTSKSGTGLVDMCIRHGGGNRCNHVDEAGTSDCRSSVVTSKSGGRITGLVGMCVKHGGGDRCQHVDGTGASDCTSSAQTSKSGTGLVGMCITHGGGDRCQLECCNLEGHMPTWSMGTHPETGQNMCRHAIRCYIAPFIGTGDTYQGLLKHFKLKKELTMRGEHAFYHALCLKVEDLRFSEAALDESVTAKLLGKRKSLQDYRPDYFHVFVDQEVSFGLHGEYDEDRDHEDSEERLVAIADASSCGRDNVYVFRVLGDHYGSQAVCKRITRKEHTYYTLTPHGERVVEETAAIVQERIAWIRQGLAPNIDRPRKVYINFERL